MDCMDGSFTSYDGAAELKSSSVVCSREVWERVSGDRKRKNDISHNFDLPTISGLNNINVNRSNVSSSLLLCIVDALLITNNGCVALIYVR